VLLCSYPHAAPAFALDYKQCAQGAAQMSRLDEELYLTVPAGEGRAFVICVIYAILREIYERGRPLGHLKFYVRWEEVSAKISFTSLSSNQMD
jgi:hypothetical protein